jgi:RNA polymerase sigma-70 factor, ECF subfamily
VRDLLLVGGADAPPKIADYGGQGPLDRWVAVVAQRQVINIVRSDAVEQRARDGVARAAAAELPAQPELALAKQRYRGEFERAMKDALAVLGDKDRLLLRLHLVSGISLDEIAKMYGVSQSTVSRWMARARDLIAAEVERLLRDRVQVSRGELASLAGLVASQIDLSMSRLLR